MDRCPIEPIEPHQAVVIFWLNNNLCIIPQVPRFDYTMYAWISGNNIMNHILHEFV